MGFVTYFIGTSNNAAAPAPEIKIIEDTTIDNGVIALTFSAASGELSSVFNHVTGQTLTVNEHTYLWYNASDGYEAPNGGSGAQQASGAYIFRPNMTFPYPVSTSPPTVTVIKGQHGLVTEVRQIWNSWVTQVVRLYNNTAWFETEHTVGEISISDGNGKEVVVRFNTSLQTQNLWYTDSIGLDVLQRKLNYRPTWNYKVTEPVSGNYVPMNMFAYIQDTNADQQLTRITDRSHGCASLAVGTFEEMLHRRLLYDDGRGVGEPLNETGQMGTIRALEWTVFDKIETSANKFRPASLLLNNPLIPLFGPPSSVSSWRNTYKTLWSTLNNQLPPNVHLLTLRQQNNGSVLFRLQHIYAINEDAQLSTNVTVDVSTLFSDFTLTSITETSLTANQPLSSVNRLHWNTATTSSYNYHTTPLRDTAVTLAPREIRTFLITLQPK